MNEFIYSRAADPAEAVQAGTHQRAMYLAGGTNVVDLMREGIERPDEVVDISRLSLADIDDQPDGGLRLGALATNSAVAGDQRIRDRYPLLARAILSGASAQLRNRATVGGNLLQRTRCGYFYDRASACNKREPGSGCDAIDGFNHMHAILGGSPHCIAVHPSDMCVALAALDAIVNIQDPDGLERQVPVTDFHLLPGDTPHLESVLGRGALVTSIDLPPARPGSSTYVKVRDRASYAFALVSIAAALEMDGERVQRVRIALGGVAPKPWRAFEAEDALVGATADEASLRHAAALALQRSTVRRDNAFKRELALRLIVGTLTDLSTGVGGDRR